MESNDWSVEVVVKDFSKEVALGIGKCLWVDFQPINVAWEKFGSHFGEIGDFLIVLGRLARHREEIVETLKKRKDAEEANVHCPCL